MKTGITITGIPQFNQILQEIAPNEARNLLRATASAMAKDVAEEARGLAPVAEGDLKGAITSRRQRGTRTLIQAMAGVGRQAFYWRFQEYGQGPDHAAHAFFLRASETLRANLEQTYLRVFGQKLEARLARLRKASGGG